jgi:hypothetical protein
MSLRRKALVSKMVSEGSWELTTGDSFFVMTDDDDRKMLNQA